jgi:hypothetical protein
MTDDLRLCDRRGPTAAWAADSWAFPYRQLIAADVRTSALRASGPVGS